MKDFLDVIRRQVTEFLGKRSKKQKIIMAASALLLVAAIIIISALLGRQEYEVLYTGLDESEAGNIMTLLEEKKVAAKAQGKGTILVASNSADEVRMELASEGYPQSGLNYDIFSSASSFGKTDLEMKTYQQYQLQENLRDTIMMLNKVEDCVVLINMSNDSMFVLSSDQQEASASVTLDLKSGEDLSAGEAKAIAELVSKSVPSLKLENVKIVDTDMTLYDVTGENQGDYTGTQYELTEQVRHTLAEQVMLVLTPVFGKDNVSAAVNVTLNFDKETVNSLELKPPTEGEENGLVVSMEELYEKTQSGNTAEGTAGTDSNGIGVSEYLYENANPDEFSRISRAINYELNQTQTQIEKAQGSIKDVSVAVLLNSNTYGEDFSEGVTQLVSKAIGVDETLVSVVSMPFQAQQEGTEAENAISAQAELMDKLTRKEIIIAAIIAIAAVVVIIYVIRFLRSIIGKPQNEAFPVLQEGDVLTLSDSDDKKIIPEYMKSEDAEQIERLVDNDPEIVAQLLRNWLMDYER